MHSCCERGVGWLLIAGIKRLTAALQAVGLKAGGTLRQRAERLFLQRDTPLEKLDRKHFAPGAAPEVWHPAPACAPAIQPVREGPGALW